jgi:hypothetical protein
MCLDSKPRGKTVGLYGIKKFCDNEDIPAVALPLGSQVSAEAIVRHGQNLNDFRVRKFSLADRTI